MAKYDEKRLKRIWKSKSDEDKCRYKSYENFKQLFNDVNV